MKRARVVPRALAFNYLRYAKENDGDYQREDREELNPGLTGE